jgi:hypothetical protein
MNNSDKNHGVFAEAVNQPCIRRLDLNHPLTVPLGVFGNEPRRSSM